MSLNEAILKYIKAVKFAQAYNTLLVDAVLLIPLAFLAARQGEQLAQAYPMIIAVMKDEFGREYIDELIKQALEKEPIDRDIRLNQERMFKFVAEQNDSVLCSATGLIGSASLAAQGTLVEIATHISANLMAYRSLYDELAIGNVQIHQAHYYLSTYSHYYHVDYRCKP